MSNCHFFYNGNIVINDNIVILKNAILSFIIEKASNLYQIIAPQDLIMHLNFYVITYCMQYKILMLMTKLSL